MARRMSLRPLEVEAASGEYSADHFVIPYVKCGRKNPSTLFLRASDKVELTVHVVLRAGLQIRTIHRRVSKNSRNSSTQSAASTPSTTSTR